MIHDGLVHGNDIYLTSVDGFVVIVDAEKRRVRRRFDLSAISGARTPLGWCPGIEVLDDFEVVVGFSRLRRTRWEDKVRWVKHRLGGTGAGMLPTRIAAFDLRRERLRWEIDLEPAGMNAIFSIHRVGDASRSGSH